MLWPSESLWPGDLWVSDIPIDTIRLVWNERGTRFFHAGVDRGVLYPENGPGVAWNGLLSVNESANSATPVEYYIDGFKYANILELGQFTATIEAYNSPFEFIGYDGTSQIANGLFITEQPRNSFGFSYRTHIGNDIVGVDHAYEIHLVYGAIAVPSSVSYTTIDSSITPMIYNWDLSTLPVMLENHRPTAHFKIDSRYTNPYILQLVESKLYGTNLEEPYLPDIEELLEIFSSV